MYICMYVCSVILNPKPMFGKFLIIIMTCSALLDLGRLSHLYSDYFYDMKATQTMTRRVVKEPHRLASNH